MYNNSNILTFVLHSVKKITTVKIQDFILTAIELKCGVPQGSVMGLILFTMYCSSVEVIHKFMPYRIICMLHNYYVDFF